MVDARPNQRWDLGEAIADFSKCLAVGFMGFTAWTSKSFEHCGLGSRFESTIDEEEEALDPLNSSLIVWNPCANISSSSYSRSYSRTSNNTLTLGFNSRRRSRSIRRTASACTGGGSGGSGGGGDGHGVINARGTAQLRAVTFSHDVEVACEWRQHLAAIGHETKPEGRARAMTMVEGDDNDEFLSLVEAAYVKRVRKTIVQAPRMYSRAARFAFEGEYNGGGGCGGSSSSSRRTRRTSRDNGRGVGEVGRRGGQVLAYGRMRDIIAAGRGVGGGFKGHRAAGFQGGVRGFVDDDQDSDEEEEEEEGGAAVSLLESYDGSLESLRSLVFPPTKSSRPAKKLFDDAVLASSTPAQWMTASDLDGILSRIKGWKAGSIRNDGNRRRQWRKKNGVYCHDRVDLGASAAAAATADAAAASAAASSAAAAAAAAKEKSHRLWVDNSVLKEKLFGLALEEPRTSVLFKRAFLNWEGSSA